MLPGFGGVEDGDRAIYSVYAAENSVFMSMEKEALTIRRGPYKLIAYFGYPNYDDVYELYNLYDDPEELLDLSQKDFEIITRCTFS